jgi:hypothetical protein
MCQRTNATYLECPISYVSEAVGINGNFEMTVAVHNPSNIEMKKAEILVPPGTYRVMGYNPSSERMDLYLKVEQRCHHDYITRDMVSWDIENCKLVID